MRKKPNYLLDVNWQDENTYFTFSLFEVHRTTIRRGKLFSVKVQTILSMSSLCPETVLTCAMVIQDTSYSLVDKTFYFHSSQVMPRASVLAGAEHVISHCFVTEFLALLWINL